MNLYEAFDQKAEDWEAYTQTPLGRLREELNWRYLAPHLPPPPAVILDAGCGTGSLGIRLAQEGYQVHLLDISEKMLVIAQQKAADLTQRVTLRCEPIEKLDAIDRFDGVICHTLLEYIPDVPGVILRLARALKKGGLLSLMFVNRPAEVFNVALVKGKITAAHRLLDDPTSQSDLFSVPRQTFSSPAIRLMLVAAGIKPTAEYGVRIFADYLNSVDWKNDPAAFDNLMELEIAAAQRDPFVHVGRYGQIIGTKT